MSSGRRGNTDIPSQLRIGTRGSALARAQTEIISGLLLRRFTGMQVETRVVRTSGDVLTDRPISEIGDKGMFVRAIELALLAGDIDVAVHSLKDVPSDVETPGLALIAFPQRADARDVVVTRDGARLQAISPGARIGTGSLRRRVQLRQWRPDLEAVDIRGNVDTRLRKLDDGEYDALILAAAGLIRLGLTQRITEYLPVDRFIPDAGQGTIAVQVRSADAATIFAVSEIDDGATRVAALAERAVVQALGADCRSPVGAFASVDGDAVWIIAVAASSPDSPLHRLSRHGPASDAVRLGRELGEDLLRAVTV